MKATGETKQVFVIGCPRSGTSAMAWALAQHPKMWTAAESDFMHKMFKGNQLFSVYKESIDRPDVGWLEQNGVTYREFASYIGSGIDAMFRSRSKGLIWIDQTPGHTLIAPVLRDMFPDARFIHIVRDGKKVVHSMLNSGFENIGFKMDWTTDFEQACKTWLSYVKKGSDFVEANPDIAIQVRNEELASDPDNLFQTVHKFLGLEQDAASSDFSSKGRLNSSFGASQKNQSETSKTSDSISSIAKDWDDEKTEIYNGICEEMADILGYHSHAA